MKIGSIILENVKCFKQKEISFLKEDTNEPLSVCALVGPNGSGKSTILKAIVATFTLLNKEYAGELLGEDSVYHHGDTFTVGLQLLFHEEEQKLLEWQENQCVMFYYRDKEGDALCTPIEDTDESQETFDRYCEMLDKLEVSEQTGLIMYYDPFRFVSQKKPAGPNIQEKVGPKINALASNIKMDGSNLYRDLELKQWLVNIDYMRLKEPSERNQLIYEHIIKAFDLLMHPLRFERINQNGTLEFLNENDGQYIDIDMLSDGFKSIFSIVLDIIRRLALAPDFPEQEFYLKEAVVLIDEIDCHIHPKWQKKLIPAFRQLFPNCQFIVTTHSPFILDSLQEYEVIKIGEKNIV